MPNNTWGTYLKNPDQGLFQYFFQAKVSNALIYFKMPAFEAVPVPAGEYPADNDNTEKHDDNDGETGEDQPNNNNGKDHDEEAEDDQPFSNKELNQEHTSKIKLLWMSLLEKGVLPLSEEELKSAKRGAMSPVMEQTEGT